MSNETTTTDIAALPPADRALIVLNSTKTEADLRAMVEEAAGITEIKDKTGREQAHRMGMRLKTARTTIQKTGKAAREDATAFCNAVLTEEKRLIAITQAEETRVLGLRDAFDEKLEAERRAAEARRAEILGKIQGIRDLPTALRSASSAEIAAEREALAAFEPSADVFGDLLDDCKAAMAEACTKLDELHGQAVAEEERAAAAEAERRRIQEALAAERAAMEAERAAIEAERARIAAERAELEALRAAAQRAAEEAKAAAEAPAAAPDGAETEPASDLQWSDEEVRQFKEQGQAPIAFNVLAHPETTIEDELRGDGDEAPADVELIQGEVGQADAGITVTATDWRIRSFALHTAAQFDALAAKVNQCGFNAFADELGAVAVNLREGFHDAALAKADAEALIAADNLLVDATMEAIDALRGEQLAA